MINLLRSELTKLVTTRSTWILVGVTVLGTWPQAWSNAAAYRLPPDDPRLYGVPEPLEFHGFTMAGFGYTFVVVIGALWAASEYGGAHQIRTTLTATPRRIPVFLVRAGILAVLTALMASATMVGAVMITHAAADDGVHPVLLTPRIWTLLAGLVAAWTLTALIAFAIGTLARTTVVPLVVLLPLVIGLGSFLAGIWPLAAWFPVTAGTSLYTPPGTAGVLAAMPGGLVQFAWAAVLLLVAGVAFVRRDA